MMLHTAHTLRSNMCIQESSKHLSLFAADARKVMEEVAAQKCLKTHNGINGEYRDLETRGQWTMERIKDFWTAYVNTTNARKLCNAPCTVPIQCRCDDRWCACVGMLFR